MPLLAVPPDWRLEMAPRPGISMNAWAPVPAGDYPSRLTLTTEAVGDAELRDWQRAVDVTLSRLLRDYLVLDLERTKIAGQGGVRRLATYTDDEGRALTLEQWAVAVRGLGYTVSATSATLDYPVQGRRLATVARTLSPGVSR